MNVNKVILIGRVGNDPEVKVIKDDLMICTFSIATSNYWNDKSSGEMKSKTEWHRIVTFEKYKVDYCDKSIGKGDLVFVTGEIQTKKFGKEEGATHSGQITQIVVGKQGEIKRLSPKKEARDDFDMNSLGAEIPNSADLDDDLEDLPI